MQKWIIDNCMNYIKKYNSDYNEETLEEIEYGLVSIYLLITKIIVITLISIILGITREMLIFLLIYNIIKTPSFGLHATKSWICLLTSSIIFIGIPFLCNKIVLNQYLIIIIGLISTILLFKNSPADTHKRPIVNPKRRLVLKLITTFIAVTFIILSLITDNNFITNCFIFAILTQAIVTAPTTYKIFKLPFNNYKTYILETT